MVFLLVKADSADSASLDFSRPVGFDPAPKPLVLWKDVFTSSISRDIHFSRTSPSLRKGRKVLHLIQMASLSRMKRFVL